jgi:hypothetical protein
VTFVCQPVLCTAGGGGGGSAKTLDNIAGAKIFGKKFKNISGKFVRASYTLKLKIEFFNQRQRKTCVSSEVPSYSFLQHKSNIQLHCDIITINRDSRDAPLSIPEFTTDFSNRVIWRIFVPGKISSYNDKHANSHIVFNEQLVTAITTTTYY